MAKFNRTATAEKRLESHPSATVNHEGGLAFKVSPEMELYLRACTSLIEDKFYTSSDRHLSETRALIHACDRKYVLQLANYVRNRMHLRSMALVLLAEAASLEREKGESKADVRAYVPKIVRRADEPAELLAYWINVIGNGTKRNLPNALKKGLSDALLRFDEYQFAKYNRRNGAVRLKDVVNLVHPVPDTPERSELYRKILDGELATPDTWEVNVSTKGSTAEVWNESARSMGIMALLRNLRNFEEKGAEEAIRIAIERFTDADSVRSSKQLPFRWYQAYKNVTRSDIRDALHAALDLSLENVEPWDGTTAILCDVSGSMHGQLSSKGDTRYIEVCAILGAMAAALSPRGYRVGVFDDRFEWLPDITRRDSVLTNMRRIMRRSGGATYAWLSIRSMRQERFKVDRIVLLSDMQCYNDRNAWGYRGGELLATEWEEYRREVNPNARLYSIDLAGYGTAQFLEGDPNTVLLAGWSESMLDFVRHYERGVTAVDEIRTKW